MSMTARESPARAPVAAALSGASSRRPLDLLLSGLPAVNPTAGFATAEAAEMGYETILVETRGAVGVVTLNRPGRLNALSTRLVAELVSGARRLRADAAIGAIVITGSEKAFAAGADIKEMQAKTYIRAYMDDFITGWERIARCASR